MYIYVYIYIYIYIYIVTLILWLVWHVANYCVSAHMCREDETYEFSHPMLVYLCAIWSESERPQVSVGRWHVVMYAYIYIYICMYTYRWEAELTSSSNTSACPDMMTCQAAGSWAWSHELKINWPLLRAVSVALCANSLTCAGLRTCACVLRTFVLTSVVKLCADCV